MRVPLLPSAVYVQLHFIPLQQKKKACYLGSHVPPLASHRIPSRVRAPLFEKDWFKIPALVLVSAIPITVTMAVSPNVSPVYTIGFTQQKYFKLSFKGRGGVSLLNPYW